MKTEALELSEFLETYTRRSGEEIFILLPDSDLEEIGEDCLIVTHGTIDRKTVGRAVLQTVINYLYARARFESIYSILPATDKAVLDYLDRLRREGDGETCTIGYPTIAKVCNVSERTAQDSIKRLKKAELVARVGYDFGNRDRSKRGNIYKLLFTSKSPSYSPRLSIRTAPRTARARGTSERRLMLNV